jgi:hypothetical protein
VYVLPGRFVKTIVRKSTSGSTPYASGPNHQIRSLRLEPHRHLPYRNSVEFRPPVTPGLGHGTGVPLASLVRKFPDISTSQLSVLFWHKTRWLARMILGIAEKQTIPNCRVE